MGFKKDAYATVWEVQSMSGTFTKVRISTSKKNKQTGEYDTDFSGFVAFIGSACAGKALKLKPKDRIRLGDCEVTTKYVKEKNTTYTNYSVFDFLAPGEGEQNKTQKKTTNVQRPSSNSFIDEGLDGANDEAELPF